MIIGISVRLDYPETENGRAVRRALEIAQELGDYVREGDIPWEVKVKVNRQVIHTQGGL